jgi:hypothetical protein
MELTQEGEDLSQVSLIQTVAEGLYDATITKVEKVQNKPGGKFVDRINVHCMLQGVTHDIQGREVSPTARITLIYAINYTPSAGLSKSDRDNYIAMRQRSLRRLQLAVGAEGKGLSTEDLLNKKIQVVVETEEYNGEKQSRIKRLVPASEATTGTAEFEDVPF